MTRVPLEVWLNHTDAFLKELQDSMDRGIPVDTEQFNKICSPDYFPAEAQHGGKVASFQRWAQEILDGMRKYDDRHPFSGVVQGIMNIVPQRPPPANVVPPVNTPAVASLVNTGGPPPALVNNDGVRSTNAVSLVNTRVPPGFVQDSTTPAPTLTDLFPPTFFGKFVTPPTVAPSLTPDDEGIKRRRLNMDPQHQQNLQHQQQKLQLMQQQQHQQQIQQPQEIQDSHQPQIQQPQQIQQPLPHLQLMQQPQQPGAGPWDSDFLRKENVSQIMTDLMVQNFLHPAPHDKEFTDPQMKSIVVALYHSNDTATSNIATMEGSITTLEAQMESLSSTMEQRFEALPATMDQRLQALSTKVDSDMDKLVQTLSTAMDQKIRALSTSINQALESRLLEMNNNSGIVVPEDNSTPAAVDGPDDTQGNGINEDPFATSATAPPAADSTDPAGNGGHDTETNSINHDPFGV